MTPRKSVVSANYAARHHVRKFLLAYAPPSALDELLDATVPDDWAQLIRDVRTEICGPEITNAE